MIDLNKYKEFVDGVTSPASKSLEDTVQRMVDIQKMGVPHPSRLLTGSIGMSGELGEFNELIKKLLFHSKNFDEKYEERMKSELADIMWYWTQVCLAMEWDPNEVIALNVEKLKDRHPDGEFNPIYKDWVDYD